MPFPDHADVMGEIAQLWIYPIKSCAGMPVSEARLTETGLEWDRAWMVVDESGDFRTQRELPRMALIVPSVTAEALVLNAPGMPALPVTLQATGAATQARVWKDRVAALDMGDAVAQWLTQFLGCPSRLVRFDPQHRRVADPDWTQGQEAVAQFSDAFPLLVASAAAMDGLNTRLAQAGHGAVDMVRFRPNIVLGGVEEHDEDRMETIAIAVEGGESVVLSPCKPCTRCTIPDVDPVTAQSGTAVGEALQTYRRDPRMDGGITFGMNAFTLEGLGQVLRVGQRVAGDLRFD